MTKRKRKRLDLAGQRYGSLVVIKEVPMPDHLKGALARYWLCVCDCGNQATVRQGGLSAGKTKSCGHLVDAKERFFSKVNKTDYCWLWTAGINEDGYGLFKYLGKTVGAHRLSWQLHNGEIPKGKHVLHICDTPACTKPSHLFLDDHAGNMKDRDVKGRQAKGEEIGLAKLTEKQVIEIRSLYAAGSIYQYELAALFKVTTPTIWHLLNGKTWKHI